ncbi:MAG: gamma-glutamyltransferase [Nitriliruptoraceae bacterium]|nr:gamma-glutamyltransferase [Nitriliruptoraceae bacterium]
MVSTPDDPAAVRGSGMGGGVVPGLFDPPEAMRPTVIGDRAAVVGGHHLTTQVALEVLAAGGNAVDAGVAASIASAVVQPDMCNLGGIAPILVRRAGQATVHEVGGVGVWGREASLEGFLARHGTRMPRGGPIAIVPGAPGAYLESLARFGTWSFRDVAAPAIELAHEGFVVDHRLAHTLGTMVDGVDWTSTRRVYQPDGQALRAGDRLVQRDLAGVLQQLVEAEHGASRQEAIEAVRRCFYEGEIAQRIAAAVTDDGGWMTPDDLASYRTEVAPAPARQVGEWSVHATSTWSQGLIVLQALGIVDPMELGDGPLDPRWIHVVTEALKLAFSERERAYGDPSVIDVDVAGLLADDHLTALRARIGEAALPNLPTVPNHRSTTYLCVVDAAGNAFSCAPSDTIDGAPLIEGLGFMCSPRGVQSRLVAGHPNVLAAGKRPCITPAPAIALAPGEADDDQRVWAFGCPGGDVIVQAMVQGFLHVTRAGMTPQEAVEAPRSAGFSFPGGFHPHPEASGVLFVEDRVPAATMDALRARGHDVRPWPGYEFDAGSVQMALDLRAPQGGRRVLGAAADPRRSAYAGAR